MSSYESRVNLLSDAQLPAGASSTTLQPDVDLESGPKPQLSSGTESAPNNGNAAGGGSNVAMEYLRASSHPTVLIFHLLFRTAALLTYLFGTIFTSNFILIFVCIVLLLAFDFWTVKNVSGRLLVGLRWWNEVREDGTSHWVFESRDPSHKLNAADSRIFWWSLYLYPVIWLFFGFISLLKLSFSWLLVIAVAILLNAANVYGYTQCDKDAKRRWATNFATDAMTGNAGGFVGRIFSSGFRRFMG
ncbi:uncharacterized protein VTP21DRAFT_215 [Calcarisporiella thermophila]|uniref:uncharacterized protein n=1 Tax=Calcarisporiella thermophila TaxID=911321 RepID=UPI0037443ABC